MGTPGSKGTSKGRSKRRNVALGADLESRIEALRARLRPPPPYAAIVRAAVEQGLSAFEPSAPQLVADAPPKAA